MRDLPLLTRYFDTRLKSFYFTNSQLKTSRSDRSLYYIFFFLLIPFNFLYSLASVTDAMTHIRKEEKVDLGIR